MCLLVVASRCIPGMPLLVGANRDEFLDRPAVAAMVLRARSPRVLGGRDARAGGTWLAVNEHGVVAGLTNQPLGEARDPARRTRGELPLALAGYPSAADAVGSFLDRFSRADYNGAWLLVGDRSSLYFIDFTDGGGKDAVELPPGTHVLENRALGMPSAKCDRVRERLGPFSGEADDALARMRSVLRDHEITDTTRERPESSANCVHIDGYGTRSSALVHCPEDPGAQPRLMVADGTPCTEPYHDVTGLWRSAPP